MIKFILKKRTDYLIFTLLLITSLGFVLLENSWPLTIIALILFGFALWRYFQNNQHDWLALVVLFFGLTVLYKLHDDLSWPLSLMMLGGVAITACLFFFYSGAREGFPRLVYTALLSLIVLEIFLALMPFPIDARSKSLAVVAIYFLFDETIKLKIKDSINAKNMIFPLAIAMIILFLALLSSPWRGY